MYAIYYRGEFPAYRHLAEANRAECRQPIYVGRSQPKGGRKGGLRNVPVATGTALALRLRKHAASIRSAPALDLKDFRFRYLVLDEIWVPLGENILIETFQPVWNVVVDGFGNHDPG